MARKRFTAEQIIIKLREAEVGLAQGKRSETTASNGPCHVKFSNLDPGDFGVAFWDGHHLLQTSPLSTGHHSTRRLALCPVHSELSGCGGSSCGARSGYFLRERTALVPQVGCADCPKPAPHATHSQRLLAS